MQLLIYGAKSLALGVYRAIQRCDPSCCVPCFLVTSLVGNPYTLAGLPVREISEFTSELENTSPNDYHILIAAPEDQHPGIIRAIEENGYHHYSCMDSRKESDWMEHYFSKVGLFPSLHSLNQGSEQAKLKVCMARFHRDRELTNEVKIPRWVYPVQVGAALANVRLDGDADDSGKNISDRNANYCELTALYWLWKNQLLIASPDDAEYYGLFHYRRILDITEEDLFRLKANNVDVVLPFPTLHEPDMSEHHSRYVSEADWQAMRKALAEIHPEYVQVLSEILEQPFFYNYNLILAKKQVLSDYCKWLFPVLMRTEELSVPKGWQRKDRYIGYLGENLLTVYFLYHKQRLNLYHTGRLMLV